MVGVVHVSKANDTYENVIMRPITLFTNLKQIKKGTQNIVKPAPTKLVFSVPCTSGPVSCARSRLLRLCYAGSTVP